MRAMSKEGRVGIDPEHMSSAIRRRHESAIKQYTYSPV